MHILLTSDSLLLTGDICSLESDEYRLSPLPAHRDQGVVIYTADKAGNPDINNGVGPEIVTSHWLNKLNKCEGQNPGEPPVTVIVNY